MSKSKRRKKKIQINWRERWLMCFMQMTLAGLGKAYIDTRPLDEQIKLPYPSGDDGTLLLFWEHRMALAAENARKQGYYIPKVQVDEDGNFILSAEDKIHFNWITPDEVAKRSIVWRREGK